MALIFDPRCEEQLKKEYVALHHFNLPLCKMMEELAKYVFEISKQDVTITCICRSQAQNDAIYSCLREKARPKPRKTAHSVFAAIDIRSRGLENHLQKMLYWLNSHNDRNANPTKTGQTAIFHEVKGHGPHFHIQYQQKSIVKKPLLKEAEKHNAM